MSRVTGNGVAKLSVVEYIASIFEKKSFCFPQCSALASMYEKVTSENIFQMEAPSVEEQDSFRKSKNDFQQGVNLNTFRRFGFYFIFRSAKRALYEWVMSGNQVPWKLRFE